jgi:hypothetical protein
LYRQASIEKKELKKKKQTSAGLVEDVFPTVSGITIQMKYVHKAIVPIVMDRTVNVFPSSYAYFHMDCMVKGCEKGGYNLTPVINGMIKKKKRVSKGELKCSGKNGSIPSDHALVSYEINIKYGKKSGKKK